MSSQDLIKLFAQDQTIFSFKDLAMQIGLTDESRLKNRINYYVKQGYLIQVRKGLYAKNANCNPLELGNKIIKPSYISLETVTAIEGITFQYYEKVFLISYLSREIKVGQYTFEYRKIKDEVLYNLKGLDQKDGYWIATKERAFLDRVYLSPDYYFDSLDSIDWDFCFELAEIYKSQALNHRLKSYYKDYNKGDK